MTPPFSSLFPRRQLDVVPREQSGVVALETVGAGSDSGDSAGVGGRGRGRGRGKRTKGKSSSSSKAKKKKKQKAKNEGNEGGAPTRGDFGDHVVAQLKEETVGLGGTGTSAWD